MVVFDDVHVPYERCFTLGDPELCNGFYTETDALQHMTHQVVTRTTAKTEYMLGLTTLLIESIGIGQFQHVQADLAEIITTLETLRALGRAAEADASVNAYGVLTPAWPPLNTARNLYPKLYQRFPEILRKLGASGLMATPTEADVTGNAAADIDTYLQAATLIGRGPGQAVPPGLGHLRVGVRQPPGAVRVLLLRRPGAHRDRLRGQLRQVAVRRPGPRLPRRD